MGRDVGEPIRVAVTLERAIQVVGCPTCKAQPGHPCKTLGGRLAPCHSPRYELAKQYDAERRKREQWERDAR